MLCKFRENKRVIWESSMPASGFCPWYLVFNLVFEDRKLSISQSLGNLHLYKTKVICPLPLDPAICNSTSIFILQIIGQVQIISHIGSLMKYSKKKEYQNKTKMPEVLENPRSSSLFFFFNFKFKIDLRLKTWHKESKMK